MSDPSEHGSSFQADGTTKSQAPANPQTSPAALDTSPTMPQTIEPGTQSSTQPAAAVQHSSSSPTPPSPSADLTFVFPIMKLPPELRLNIFDQLFLDLTVNRQRFMMYHNEEKLLQKRRVNDFCPYTNLLLTCKELNKEAKNHWEKFYLHQCCFYFWHVSELYDLSLVLEKLGEHYTEIKYVLRSQWAENHVSRFCLANTVSRVIRFESENFMSCQPGVSSDFPDEFEEQFKDRVHGSSGRYTRMAEGIYEITDENPVRAVVCKDETGKTFARGEYPGPESCEISTHQDDTPLGDGGFRADRYAQMQGKFSGIFWGGYDAAEDYGKFKIWEATPKCHGHGHCRCEEWDDPENRFHYEELIKLDKKERESLVQRWYDTIIGDQRWLTLGGEHKDSWLDLAHDYGMEYWFDDEYWYHCADEYWASWDFDEDEEEGEDGEEEEDAEEEEE